MIVSKPTLKLFCKKYKFKAVIVNRFSYQFNRCSKYDTLVKHIDEITQNCGTDKDKYEECKNDGIVALALYNELDKLTDYNIMVSYPYITIYTNDEATIDKLVTLFSDSIKFISKPIPGTEHLLDANKTITRNIDHGYKITLVYNINQNLSNFVEWCKVNKKNVKASQIMLKSLSEDRTYGNFYFYVKNAKMLTMAKMFLGNYIKYVEETQKI